MMKCEVIWNNGCSIMAAVVDDCACLAYDSICSGCLHGVPMGPTGWHQLAGVMAVSAVPRLPTRSSTALTTLGVRELRLPATGSPPLGRPNFPNDAYCRLPCPLLGILWKKKVFFELFGRFLGDLFHKLLPRNINDDYGRFRFSHNALVLSILLIVITSC